MSTDLSSLEQRIAAIEDKLSILNLIASHPLSADTGYGPLFPLLYTDDAVFDRGPNLQGATGRDSLIEFVESQAHRTAIEGGLAHFGNLPFIVELQENEAQVVSYIMIVTANQNGVEQPLSNHGTSKGHGIFRVVANRWTVVRTGEGWRIKTRTLFPMDGTGPARQLLQEVVEKRCALEA